MMTVELLFGGWLAINLLASVFTLSILSDMKRVGMIKGDGSYKDAVEARRVRLIVPLPYVVVVGCNNVCRKARLKKGEQ